MIKKSSKEKMQYLKIYNNAHNNAVDLLSDAKTLFDKKSYPRAYFLAFTALEEISKSQFAADVFTGFSDADDFIKFYIDHKKKIKRVAWAKNDADSYPHNIIWVGPDREDVEQIEATEPLLKKRNNALYVGIFNKQILLPSNEITKEDARGLIHVVDTALKRIWETTEYWGHQIGTKGFMK